MYIFLYRQRCNFQLFMIINHFIYFLCKSFFVLLFISIVIVIWDWNFSIRQFLNYENPRAADNPIRITAYKASANQNPPILKACPGLDQWPYSFDFWSFEYLESEEFSQISVISSQTLKWEKENDLLNFHRNITFQGKYKF